MSQDDASDDEQSDDRTLKARLAELPDFCRCAPGARDFTVQFDDHVLCNRCGGLVGIYDEDGR